MWQDQLCATSAVPGAIVSGRRPCAIRAWLISTISLESNRESDGEEEAFAELANSDVAGAAPRASATPTTAAAIRFQVLLVTVGLLVASGLVVTSPIGLTSESLE